jgi:ABC-2 type transport system ATP-binding protein
MDKKIAISVDNVSKDFRLPHERVDSIKSLFVNPFKSRGEVKVQHALSNISFDVKKGEFFGIVGRNGSGKSTLLKVIAGIYQPTDGKILVNGRLVPFIELGVGFNPELTGFENVFLNGALMGFTDKEIKEKYEDIVKFAELQDFMDQKLKNYSSGMQVRLAFSVATILAESDILLIDEVLAVGDADFQRKCFSYFKKLKKENKTVLFVSHDMNAIREYCDKVVVIEENEIIFSGSSSDAAKEYTKLLSPDTYDQENAIVHAANRSKKEGKWGVGGVDINNLKTNNKLYKESDSYIEIYYQISPEENFDDKVIPGITIKNEKGESVCGTNTEILSMSKMHIKDKTIGTTWKVPNIFNEGIYFIEPAVISGTSRQTLQWWNDAISFRVINSKSSPHQVAPDISVKQDTVA